MSQDAISPADMAATMEQAFDAASEASSEAVGEAVAVETPAEPTGRPRDDQGRFVASDNSSEGAGDTEPASEEVSAEDVAAPETAGEAETLISAPVSWSDADKEVFDALPPEVREIISERESQRDKGFQEKAQELAEIRKQFEPLQGVMAQRGVGMDWIAELIRLSDFAGAQPQAFLEHFAQQHGLSLQNTQSGDSLDVDDPYLEEIHKIKSQTQAALSEIRAQQQASQLAGHQATVDAFRAETDSAGNLAHPHFERVEDMMVKLITGGIAADLRSAYQQSLQLVPAVASEIAAANQQRTEVDELSKARAAADRAKRAKAKLLRSAPGPAPTEKLSSMSQEQLMAKVYDEMNG
jgi:hypothetical protein